VVEEEEKGISGYADIMAVHEITSLLVIESNTFGDIKAVIHKKREIKR
jgi:hypothetical protein